MCNNTKKNFDSQQEKKVGPYQSLYTKIKTEREIEYIHVWPVCVCDWTGKFFYFFCIIMIGVCVWE